MQIKTAVALAPYTSFKIGGSADFFVSVSSVEELAEACRYARARALPILILGGGSNMLLPDEGWKGLVVHVAIKEITTCNCRDFDADTVDVVVGAGENWDDFVAWTVEKGLWGIENLSGIPGTVGATPIQNVGAYGVEVAETITWVEYFDARHECLEKIENIACNFTYRGSILKSNPQWVVTRVCFGLSRASLRKLVYRDIVAHFAKQNAPTQTEIRDAVRTIRAQKFPDLSVYGTAGSFFKNPILTTADVDILSIKYPSLPRFSAGKGKEKISLAWILDHVLALRGHRNGAVGLYEHQPLVLVNYDNANACDVRAFANDITEKVFNETNVCIEPEVRIVTQIKK